MSFTFGWNTPPHTHPPLSELCFYLYIVKDQKWSCKKQTKNGYHGKKMKFLKMI